MSDPQNDLVTSGTAADIIGIELEAFRQRMKRGALTIEPAALLAGHYLWTRCDVEHYAAVEAAR